MAVTRKYTGEDDRHYPFLPLADGTVGWTASNGATVEIATADDVPDDGRFDTVKSHSKKKTTTTPEPDELTEVDEPAATDEGDQQ